MELDLTQEELAERVGEGVRQSEISRLERNRVTLPRRQRMEQIAVALDIPVGVLLARSGWVGAEEIEASPAMDRAADDAPFDLEPAADEDQANGHMPRFETIASDNATVVAVRKSSGPQFESDAELPETGWGDDAGDLRDLFHVLDERGQHRHADSLSAADSQSLRDTVTRAEALIQQARERIDDSHSTLVRGRRSVDRRQPTDPS